MATVLLLLAAPGSLLAAWGAPRCHVAMSGPEPSLREAIMSQRAAGKSDREILLGLSDLIGASADLIDDTSLLSQLSTDEDEPDSVPMPRAGAEPFGRWFQSEGHISLELFVDAEPRDVRCEALVGFLDVRVKDEPLLSGRLAQPVLPDVDWVLDSDDAALGEAPARRLLCIELTKRQRTPVVDSGGGFGVALFESLKVRGDRPGLHAYHANGLVTGRYLPERKYMSELASATEDPGWSAENELTTG